MCFFVQKGYPAAHFVIKIIDGMMLIAQANQKVMSGSSADGLCIQKRSTRTTAGLSDSIIEKK